MDKFFDKRPILLAVVKGAASFGGQTALYVMMNLILQKIQEGGALAEAQKMIQSLELDLARADTAIKSGTKDREDLVSIIRDGSIRDQMEEHLGRLVVDAQLDPDDRPLLPETALAGLLSSYPDIFDVHPSVLLERILRSGDELDEEERYILAHLPTLIGVAQYTYLNHLTPDGYDSRHQAPPVEEESEEEEEDFYPEGLEVEDQIPTEEGSSNFDYEDEADDEADEEEVEDRKTEGSEVDDMENLAFPPGYRPPILR